MSDLEHSNGIEKHENWLYSRTGIVTICAVLILGFLIYTGHSAHLLGAAPYLLLLACPLMHIFMHGGHGGHQNKSDSRGDNDKTGEQTKKHSEGCH